MKKIPYGISSYFNFSVNDINRLKSSNFEDMDILRDVFIKLSHKNIHSPPLVMADVTSGFNIGDNISQDSQIYMEPEKRYGGEIKYGYIIELKYIKSAFLKTKAKSEPEVKRAIETATAQLVQYSPYNGCTTTKIIIVASAKKLLYMETL